MTAKKKEPVEPTPEAIELSEIEKSAVGEICDLITASLVKDLGERLDATVGMEPSAVSVVSLEELKGTVAAPVLLIQLSSTSALEGQFFLFMNGDGLPSIFDLAVAGQGQEASVDDEVILEQLQQLVNGVVSEAMSSFAGSMGHTIDCAVIGSTVLQDEAEFDTIGFLYPDGQLLHVVTTLGLPSGQVSAGYLLPTGLAGQIVELLLNDQASSVVEAPSVLTLGGEEEAVEPVVIEAPAQPAPSAPIEVSQPAVSPRPAVDMQPAQFSQISEGGSVASNSNIALLFDVMLDASIELGKTTMSIEEILKLAKGSVIELDKLASEPVEFLVNGKIIARGEVVVIDDNFGIRITEILSPRERLESL